MALVPGDLPGSDFELGLRRHIALRRSGAVLEAVAEHFAEGVKVETLGLDGTVLRCSGRERWLALERAALGAAVGLGPEAVGRGELRVFGDLSDCIYNARAGVLWVRDRRVVLGPGGLRSEADLSCWQRWVGGRVVEVRRWPGSSEQTPLSAAEAYLLTPEAGAEPLERVSGFEPLGAHDPLSMIEIRRVVMRRPGGLQDLAIIETEAFGRALFLDGLLQSAVADEAHYHEPFVHPALVLHGAPRRVLVAGAGEGATPREVLRHPEVRTVSAVDIDAEVVAASRAYLPELHAGAFDDPRLTLHIEDIRLTFAAVEPASFDVVFLDLTDPEDPRDRIAGTEGDGEGPSQGLLSVAFYRRVAASLAPGGICVVQMGELHPQVAEATAAALDDLRAVFPEVVMGHSVVPSFNSTWGFALASATPLTATPAQLRARIGALEGLRLYDLEAHHAFFMVPNAEALERAKR